MSAGSLTTCLATTLTVDVIVALSIPPPEGAIRTCESEVVFPCDTKRKWTGIVLATAAWNHLGHAEDVDQHGASLLWTLSHGEECDQSDQ